GGAVHDRHHHVQQDQAGAGGARRAQEVQRLAAVARLGHPVALVLEDPGHGVADVEVVIDDQDQRPFLGHAASVLDDTVPPSTGNSTVKVAPSPRRLSTEMAPPCASTIWRAMYSPSPKPP